MADVVGTWLGVLELFLATSVVALIVVTLTRGDGPSQSLGESLVVPAATLSFGAAAIHLWAMPSHVVEYQPFGLAFLILALFQARWAVAYLGRRPAGLLGLGLAVNAGVVAVWVWSRTSGLPWGPGANTPEPVGGADLAATCFELGLIAILILQIWPARDGLGRRQVTSRVAGNVRAFVIALVCVFTFLAATAPLHGGVDAGARVDAGQEVNLPASP